MPDITLLQAELLARGYKKWVSETTRIFKMTDSLYQKKVIDNKGKKYFIDIYYYPAGRYGNRDMEESIQAEVQFHNGDGITDNTMNVQLFVKDIDKIEEVFENMWVKLGLNYYELWSNQ